MVALRKESVDRNPGFRMEINGASVALRKESVDRNKIGKNLTDRNRRVALRKESVDRNSVAGR